MNGHVWHNPQRHTQGTGESRTVCMTYDNRLTQVAYVPGQELIIVHPIPTDESRPVKLTTSDICTTP